MRLRLGSGEWKAAAALALLALAVVLWTVGLPWPAPDKVGRGRDGPATGAHETAAWLAQVIPPAGTNGFPRWRELARLGAPDPEVSGPLGFGGLRLYLEKREGAVRWTIAVLMDSSGEGPWPVAIEVTCAAADSGGAGLVRELREGWPGETAAAERGWRARWRDGRSAAELEARVRAVLGGHRPVSAPRELREAYELLLDPLRPVVYDRGEVGAGAREPGRLALEALLAAERGDLVRNVLRGLDPEGRVYAAEALLARLEPEPQDEAALRAVLALDVPVRVRGGLRVPAREALGR